MRIADLCCGAGGSAMGLHQAFPDAEIVGVDIRPQPRYPFTFVQGDALKVDLREFDFVWASPPCQGYSRMRHLPWLKGRAYPLLIPAMRARLRTWGGPWILENVEDAPLLNGATLCGATFGLKVYRHRKFEAPFLLLAPAHLAHTEVISINGGYRLNERSVGVNANGWVSHARGRGGADTTALISTAMGIDWMRRDELAEAIPPAYSRYLAQFIPIRTGEHG